MTVISSRPQFVHAGGLQNPVISATTTYASNKQQLIFNCGTLNATIDTKWPTFLNQFFLWKLLYCDSNSNEVFFLIHNASGLIR